MTMATNLDRKASKIAPILLAMAVSSLATSWALKTPYLHKRADHATVLEKKVIPQLKDVAGCQQQRARVATSLAKASENGRDIDLGAIPNCPAIKPVPKVVVPPAQPSVNAQKLPS